jgi:hypothetical protein
MSTEEGAYIDERGRTRWCRNNEIAAKLTDLYDFLVQGMGPKMAATIATHAAEHL